jgi:hypothetical protein
MTSCAGDQKALDGLGNKMWGLAREFSDDASVLGGLAVYFDELTDGHELKGTHNPARVCCPLPGSCTMVGNGTRLVLGMTKREAW